MGKVVRFNKVLNVTDKSITVLTVDSEVITIKAPHDKDVKMNEPFNGEGFVILN